MLATAHRQERASERATLAQAGFKRRWANKPVEREEHRGGRGQKRDGRCEQ
jgi:hypothetical protein